jgi:RNA polymerase sigma factor (sigma-70 family)
LVQSEAYSFIEQHYRKNFRNLVAKYNRFLHSIARSEDVVQEAYTRALKYWSTAPSPLEDSTFGQWFTAILNNCMKDNQRTEAQHGAVAESLEDEDTITKPSAIPAILFDQVVKKIEEHSEETRKLLHLFFISQYNAKEVAQVMDMSPNAVRQTAWRFRGMIRDHFRWSI